MKKYLHLIIIIVLVVATGCSPTYEEVYLFRNETSQNVFLNYQIKGEDTLQKIINPQQELILSQRIVPGYTQNAVLSDSLPDRVVFYELKRDSLDCKKYWKNGKLWERLEEEDKRIRFRFSVQDADF